MPDAQQHAEADERVGEIMERRDPLIRFASFEQFEFEHRHQQA